MRRAFSAEDLTTHNKLWNGTDGTKVDEYYDDESYDEEDSRLGSDDSKYDILQHRRYSYPLIGQATEEVLDPFFSNQLTKIKKAVIDELYKDNVYAEPKVEEPFRA